MNSSARIEEQQERGGIRTENVQNKSYSYCHGKFVW